MEKNKNNKSGFTLLELLVVVLIIGILAGIALPQYQMAVGRTKFSELKTLTKSFQQASQRYYIINNTYQGINGHINEVLDIELPKGSDCTIWDETQDSMIRCCKQIFGQSICYYMRRDSGRNFLCVVIYDTDESSKANRLCQQETGQKTGNCSSNFCNYAY